MQEIAETRVRYGYRRIHVLLRREGWDVNAKRVYRLYKELGLQLRQKPPKRRVKAKLREGRCAASCSNEECVHRVLQRQVSGGVPEPALVHEPRRRGRKMRDLA